MAQMTGRAITRDQQAHAFAHVLAVTFASLNITDRASDKRRAANAVKVVRDALASLARLAVIDDEGKVERGAYVLPRTVTLAGDVLAEAGTSVVIDVEAIRALFESTRARRESYDTPEACDDLYSFAHFLSVWPDAPAQPDRYRRRVTGYAHDVVSIGDALDRAERKALRLANDEERAAREIIAE